MSIRQEKNGTYTLYYNTKDALTGKTRRHSKRGFKTQRDAKNYEKTIPQQSTKVTFYALYTELEDGKKQEKETRQLKDSAIKRFAPSLLTIPYEDLTKAYLIKLRNDIAKLDKAAKTKNRIIDVIKNTCAYANKIYDLDDNSKVIDRFPITKKNFDVWTMNEYYKFENALVGSKYEDTIPLFHLIYHTGMRKGEARAIQIDDVDVANSTIRINKAVRNSQKSLKGTKTESSVRTVLIDEETMKLIKPLLKNEKWVFGNTSPMSIGKVDDAFHYGIEKSGVKKIRIHDMRHSHASYLLSQGIDVVSVSQRLGHKDANITISTYAHALHDNDKKILELMKKHD